VDPLLEILKRLLDQDVELVLVGGMAAMFHGSDVVTHDIDFCIPFTTDNMSKIVAALRDLNPTFRQRPDRPPMWKEPERLATFNVMLIETTLGYVDFLRDIDGVGQFAEVLAQSQITEVAPGISCPMIGLDALITAKRAANRPKDRIALPHLEAAKRESQSPPPPEPPKTRD
jgi:hypothetical protein